MTYLSQPHATRPLATVTRWVAIAVLATVLLVATGCDSGSAMEDIGDGEPEVTTASVEINLREIVVVRDCDGGSNPGDFQFRIQIVDQGNAALMDPVDLPQGATYGVYTGQLTELVTARDTDRINLSRTISLQRERTEGNGFSIIFSGNEWDSDTTKDPSMNNRSTTRTHAYQNGSFSNIVGERTMSLGSGSCRVQLNYAVTVR